MKAVTATKPPWLIRPRSGKFVLLLVAFVILAIIAGTGASAGIDGPVALWFKSLEGNAAAEYAMAIIGSFSDVTVLAFVGIVLTIIRRTRKAGMIFLIAIVLIAVLVMYIKPAVGRQAPPFDFSPAAKLPNGAIEPDSLAPFSQGYSFPSTHVGCATAVSFIFGYAIFKRSRYGAYALWAFPIISAFARMCLLQHYLTDVIGGFIIGLEVSIFLSAIMKLEIPFAVSQLRGPVSDTR